MLDFTKVEGGNFNFSGMRFKFPNPIKYSVKW